VEHPETGNVSAQCLLDRQPDRMLPIASNVPKVVSLSDM